MRIRLLRVITMYGNKTICFQDRSHLHVYRANRSLAPDAELGDVYAACISYEQIVVLEPREPADPSIRKFQREAFAEHGQ